MNAKEFGHDLGLIFFAAIATFLFSTVISGFTTPLLASWAMQGHSAFMRGVLALLAIDGAKIAVWLPMAWLIARRIRTRTFLASVLMVFLTYGLETVLFALLGLTNDLYRDPLLLGIRGLALLLIIGMIAKVIKRRRLTAISPTTDKSNRNKNNNDKSNGQTE